MPNITGTTSNLPQVPTSSISSSIGDRQTFNFTLRVGQFDVSSSELRLILQSIRVFDQVEGASELRLRFRNLMGTPLSESNILTSGSIIQLSIGWDESGPLAPKGPFILNSWENVEGKSTNTIELLALDYTSKLSRGGEVQRVWEKTGKYIKDSDIVKFIAKKHSLFPDIDDTEVEYSRVIQASETDYDFLSKRSKLYGFQMYVSGRTLHFHKVRVLPSPHTLNLRTDPGNFKDNVNTVTFRTDTFRQAPQTLKAQVNQTTFESSLISGRYKLDELAKRDINIVPSLTLATGSSQGRPLAYLIHEGHLQSKGEIRTQLDESIKSTGFATVVGDCVTHGLEHLRAGDSIPLRFEEDRRYSGLYYIRSVEHVWDGYSEKKYVSRLNLIRSFEHLSSSSLGLIR